MSAVALPLFQHGPQAGDAVPTLGSVAEHVARLLNRSVRVVRWREDAPGGRGLVVHAPWARVVVARTAGGALRWAEAWQTGGRGGDVLWRSLQGQYPRELTAWASTAELADQPLPHQRLRGFLQWALHNREGWPLTPTTVAVGSWASWPDAVLVVRAEGAETVLQLRAAAWADFDR